jgi:hypothetical protein
VKSSFKILLIALSLSPLSLIPTSVESAVVINEVAYDDGGIDDREFVELYNDGPFAEAIGGWTLSGQDQNGANASLTIAAGAVINANSFYVIGRTGVPNVNQLVVSPLQAGYFKNNAETLELRNQGVLVDALLYESNRGPFVSPPASNGYGVLPQDVRDNVTGGFWGNAQAVDIPGTPLVSSASLARFVDGRDTNSNGRDFGVRPATPGTSNDPVRITSYSPPDVSSLAIGTQVPGFGYYFAPPRVIDPSVADTYNPNPIPALPGSPTRAIIAWDHINGTANGITSAETFATCESKFDIRAYLDTRDLPQMATGATSPVPFRGSEVTIYGIGSTDSGVAMTDLSGQAGIPNSKNGTTGIAWVYEKVAAPDPSVPASPANMVSEKLYLVDAKDGGDSGQGGTTPLYWNIITAIDLSSTNSGWFRLGIDIDTAGSGVARFENQFFNFNTAQHSGAFSVGYFENTQIGGIEVPADFLRPPTFVAIPEPNALLLFLIGALYFYRSRR